MNDKKSGQAATPSARRAIFLALLLVVLDAFYLNQGAIAAVVGLWLLFISLPYTFFAKKFAAVRKQRVRNIAIYFGAVVLVLAFNAANNAIAKRRAEVLISAVQAFHAKNQRYPRSLEELVPAYIERVPLAKYTFSLNRFSYFTLENGSDARLFYVELPPFGRPTYSFGRGEWGYID